VDGQLACALVTFDATETAVMPDGSKCYCTDEVLPNEGEFDFAFLYCLDDDCGNGQLALDSDYETLYCYYSYGCQGTIDEYGDCVDVPDCPTEWMAPYADGSLCYCPPASIPAEALDDNGDILYEAEFVAYGVAPESFFAG